VADRGNILARYWSAFTKARNLNLLAELGPGYSDKLLSSLSSELNKIRVDKCPFYNLPAAGRNRWDQGLTAAEMKRCHWVKPVMVCQIKFTEWTRDDRLRQPVFLGLREDKSASEVVREQVSAAISYTRFLNANRSSSTNPWTNCSHGKRRTSGLASAGNRNLE
jgi:ATP-dependent DNA ligase